MANIRTRIRNAWNAFADKNQNAYQNATNFGEYASFIRPDRPHFTRGNERSMVNAVYNRIAMDVASIAIHHVRLDDNGRFASIIDSGLDSCLNIDANADQTGRALIQDIVMSMLDEGVVAVIPVDTSIDPIKTSSYDILSMRTGRILAWYPDRVRVDVYNERNGRHEEIVLPKKSIAIIENPLYAVMNEKSSTLQRLIRKLNLLDVVDEQSSSGKLDLIIQLPYVVKTDTRRNQAEQRRKAIEEQLAGSKYGIAYTDATEKITQLNRSVDNNLLTQVQYLMDLFYSQLGISQSVMNGTASEQEMLNYNNRTIEPIVSAISDEFKRKFLTKTARSQGQSIMFFREPFKLVPVSQIAEIADKFTRNEIMTANEMRQVVGMKPVPDEKADQLKNANISHPDEYGYSDYSENSSGYGMPISSEDAISSVLDIPISDINE